MKANPLTGAVARACTDPDYRSRLVADARSALAEAGVDVPADVEIRVHESTHDKLLVVLPTADALETMSASAGVEVTARRPGDGSERADFDLPIGPVDNVPDGLSLEWNECTLTAAGRVDESTAGALQRALERAFVDIEVDLEQVTFLSSAGLSALIAAQERLARRECSLCLFNVPEHIRNVFALSGLAELFEFVSRGDPGYWRKCRTALDYVFGVPGS